MAGAFKVTIDRDDCISCAACWSACPEFFEENPDDAYSQVIAKYRVGGDIGEGEAPADLEACVKDAESGCPVEIIHVTPK
jgi:ferredoxin